MKLIVLGGGVAGLAAALRASRRGWKVTLLEASPKLGGRAYSFSPRRGGVEIDNGQHVLMGCCHATLAYLEACGTRDLLERRKGMALQFFHRDGRSASLTAGTLPHPIGLAQAFLSYSMLPLSARLRIASVAWKLRSITGADREELDGMTAAAWLRLLRQDRASLECFWRPVVLATMNSDIDRASAWLLTVVLREIFLGSADAADMLLPKTGLTPLLVDGALAELWSAGAEVQCSLRADSILIRDGAVRGIRTSEGEEIPADAVISAIPPWALERLARESGVLEQLAIDFSRFEASEILSLHFWTRRDLRLPRMTGLLETRLHWIFSKEKESDNRYHYSATVSAVPEDFPAGENALRALLHDELALAVPDLRDEDIDRIMPIREKRATFVPAPGLESIRPDPTTSIPGLYLAGDWTNTGLPATIESAVRSGNRAAELLRLD
ncbi:hydroxysqualene dehydroxylase HpnE [bacterium]|nr:hydroxysqualene dehydroxylase HpnE [bacterium]